MTIKQDWSAARNYVASGRLLGICANLRSFCRNPEILPFEAEQLQKAIELISEVLVNFNTTTSKTLSFEQYCAVKKIGSRGII